MELLAKVISFDLDGTLAESKRPITEETALLLIELAKRTKVAVISGGSFAVMSSQLQPFTKIAGEEISNLIILPGDGSERFEYDKYQKIWKMTDRRGFSEKIKDKVKKALKDVIMSAEFDIPREHYGDYIDDRDTQITLSALGQEAPLEKKEAWDPDQQKRLKIRKYLEDKLPEAEVSIAGTTSVDILPKGFNKAVGLGIFLEHEDISTADMVFIGDALFPGGNDYSVHEAGIQTIRVKGAEEARVIIRKMLEAPVAFFCSEYAIDDEDTSMYAGGLGVLAGDYLLECAKQGVPMAAFGVRYIHPVNFDAGAALGNYKILSLDGEKIVIDIPVGPGFIKAQVWHKRVGGNTHLFLLDPDVPENNEEDRRVTAHLYDIDFKVRLKQQIILGIGSVKLIEKLGIKPRIYHLNEGHTVFAGIALLVEKPEEREKVVGSKHTILSNAGLQIPRNIFEDLLAPYCEANRSKHDNESILQRIYEMGRFELSSEIFSTTKLVINVAIRKNGVSAAHAYFEKKKHPHSQLISITNGVNQERWQAPQMEGKSVYSSDSQLWQTKKELKRELSHFLEKHIERTIDPDIATVVWARRFAAYKRPELLFLDRQRLIGMVTSEKAPLQLIISGRPHMSDKEGMSIAEMIHHVSGDPTTKGRVIFVPDYSITVAKQLVRGADIWLNTPERGYEACGTSGMKAALNGSIMMSVSDGWMDEIKWEGKGWILPDLDARDVDERDMAMALYDLLEKQALPIYYKHDKEGIPREWVQRMRQTMEIVEKNYTTKRMLDDYRDKLYQ